MSDENAGYDKDSLGKSIALEPRDTLTDGRKFSPSTGRNKDAVRDAFLEHMPTIGHVLEIASGTGEHGAHITAAANQLTWIYSDVDPQGMESQRAWAQHEANGRLLGPIELDASDDKWTNVEDHEPVDGIFNANMIHISPFMVAEGLFAGAGRIIRPGGKLMLYGPFSRRGDIAPSNARFSEDLKRRDSSWGVRDLDRELLPLAEIAGLVLTDVVDMPANNLSVIFQRT